MRKQIFDVLHLDSIHSGAVRPKKQNIRTGEKPTKRDSEIPTDSKDTIERNAIFIYHNGACMAYMCTRCTLFGSTNGVSMSSQSCYTFHCILNNKNDGHKHMSRLSTQKNVKPMFWSFIFLVALCNNQEHEHHTTRLCRSIGMCQKWLQISKYVKNFPWCFEM